MNKKKRKRKGDYPYNPYAECGQPHPQPYIAQSMFGKGYWLATELGTKTLYNRLFWGYFQRAVVFNEYQFPHHICISMN